MAATFVCFVYFEGHPTFPNPVLYTIDRIDGPVNGIFHELKGQELKDKILASSEVALALGVEPGSISEVPGKITTFNNPAYKDTITRRFYFEHPAAPDSEEDDLYGCIDVVKFTYFCDMIPLVPMWSSHIADPSEFLKEMIDTVNRDEDPVKSDIEVMNVDVMLSEICTKFEVDRDKAIDILSCFGFEIDGKFTPIIKRRIQ